MLQHCQQHRISLGFLTEPDRIDMGIDIDIEMGTDIQTQLVRWMDRPTDRRIDAIDGLDGIDGQTDGRRDGWIDSNVCLPG